VIGPPLVSGSDQLTVTKSLVQLVVGVTGFEGLAAAKTETSDELSPKPS